VPLVSVVVATRNSARTLETCLASIRSQQSAEVELIVVDNNSSDTTAKIARRYGDLVVTKGPERSAQRNYGASLASGDFLLFIDSDMILEPDVVSSCLAVVEETEAPAVIVPEMSIGQGFWAACRALERSCYAGDDGIEAARFFKRELFERCGGFDEDLTGPEDWDITDRVATGNHLPRATSTIVHDEGRLTLRADLAKKRYYAGSSLRYWRKHRVKATRQANLVLRPAFLRSRRLLFRHPTLAAGVLSLKTLEALAILLGLMEGAVRARSLRKPSKSR